MVEQKRTPSSKRNGINAFGAAFIFGAALWSTPTLAQDLRVGCSLVQQYDGAQVKLLLEQARPMLAQGEADALHAKYIGLRSDCGANHNASRLIRLSPAMQRLLDEYGVNLGRFAVAAH
ncbi:hypothetical protein V3H18_03240 [Methylocystis sp. 9N]|uniref:Uncharacterized protein n=1 Tax=Methylocystis borbori TaxID=3118750 RepID=A0ABU7XEJ6_9HYPH